MGMVMALIIMALNIYSIVVVLRVLLSWFPNVDYSNPLVRFLYDATEPVLRPVRQALPATPGIDFSPMVVLIAISVISMILRNF